uniref:Endo/exonuclease/phosphatase domain-containing protein n=1 Tax=Schistocephalus solidus TaxID=70667 RepID=A0A183TFZ5_SCHSO
LVPNSHLWLLEVGFFPAATPRTTVTTGGLNQVMVYGIVCASTPGMSDSQTSHLPTNSNLAARVSPLTPAAWNVRCLLDNPRSNRPERRMAVVAWELARYNLDIAALSETRFSEQGHLEEVGAGYTFFWSGWTKVERRDAGVAFAIRYDIGGRLPCLPQGINDRLMSLHLSLQDEQFVTIISAYAPPMTSSGVVKDKFYEDLHALLATVSKVYKLIRVEDALTDKAWASTMLVRGAGDFRAALLAFAAHDVDAEDSSPLLDFRVRDRVLPSQLQYSAEAAEMEVIQLPCLVRVDSPGLRSEKECRQDDGLVYLQFGFQVNTVVIPHGDLQPVKV